jgi:hypothetical protein
MKVLRRKDSLLGVMVCLAAAFFFWHTRDIPGGAAIFPRLLLALIGFFGLLLLIQDLLAGIKESAASTGETRESKYISKTAVGDFVRQILMPASILIISVALLKYMGFYAVSAFAIIAIMLYQDWIDRVKPNIPIFLKHVIFSVCVITGLYILFNLILSLPTPRGVFGF